MPHKKVLETGRAILAAIPNVAATMTAVFVIYPAYATLS